MTSDKPLYHSHVLNPTLLRIIVAGAVTQITRQLTHQSKANEMANKEILIINFVFSVWYIFQLVEIVVIS